MKDSSQDTENTSVFSAIGGFLLVLLVNAAICYGIYWLFNRTIKQPSLPLLACSGVVFCMILFGVFFIFGDFLRRKRRESDLLEHDLTPYPSYLKEEMAELDRLEADLQRNPQAYIQIVKAYERFLEQITGESGVLRASIKNRLGCALAEMPQGNRQENIGRAVDYFQEALEVRTFDKYQRDYAMTQSNLGAAYRNLSTPSRYENLKHALACYQEALRVYTPETDIVNYATTKSNQGIAYRNLMQTERAIECYKEALRYCTKHDAPMDYAMIQNNLGVAYTERGGGDWIENQYQAENCFNEALNFWTLKANPLDYAMLHNNLGGVYVNLANWLPAECEKHRDDAIEHFSIALKLRAPEKNANGYAITQHGMGFAYLASAIDVPEDTQNAMGCFQEALQFFKPESAPREYASTQNGLGHAYARSKTGDHHSNLERASKCYQAALQYLKPHEDPHYYACLQRNLGDVLLELGDENQAVACYQDALRLWRTPILSPHNYRNVSRKLGDLHFSQQRWQLAQETYRPALDAGEWLYKISLSLKSKIGETRENARIYQNTAYATARLGDPTKAFLTLEEGKTWLLSEELRWQATRPEGVPDHLWTAYQHAVEVVSPMPFEVNNQIGSTGNLLEAYQDREQCLRVTRKDLETIIKEIQKNAPDLLRRLDLPTVLASLPNEQTAMISFCITEHGSYVFVVTAQNKDSVLAQEVSGFTLQSLHNLVQYWIKLILQEKSYNFEVIRQNLEDILQKIGETLLAPVLSLLPSNIKHIIFLPAGDLFLLPLHAAPYREGRVCDQYQVSYAPSATILANCQQKDKQAKGEGLYIVTEPSLPFALLEVNNLADLFNQPAPVAQLASKQQVVKQAAGRAYLHFACHGIYDWKDPLQSGLKLDDGRFTLSDLRNKEINLSTTRLVVLSACETGLVDVIWGSAEEYFGLPAGFLLAGVPCVLSTLWPVEDLSTALLMLHFYQNVITNKMDFPQALQDAQIWLRKLNGAEVIALLGKYHFQPDANYGMVIKANQQPNSLLFEDPFYWAAFTINGA